MSWNLGPSISWNAQGLSRPVMRLLYLSQPNLPLQCLSPTKRFLISTTEAQWFPHFITPRPWIARISSSNVSLPILSLPSSVSPGLPTVLIHPRPAYLLSRPHWQHSSAILLWHNQQMQLYAVNFIPLLGSPYMFRVFYTPIIRSTIYNCIYSHWYKP